MTVNESVTDKFEIKSEVYFNLTNEFSVIFKQKCDCVYVYEFVCVCTRVFDCVCVCVFTCACVFLIHKQLNLEFNQNKTNTYK